MTLSTINKKFDFKGTIQGFSGNKESSEIFFHFVSFLVPGIIYHFDFAAKSSEPVIFKEVKLQTNFDREDYIVEQVFYKSRDGESIPMSIIRKKGKLHCATRHILKNNIFVLTKTNQRP